MSVRVLFCALSSPGLLFPFVPIAKRLEQQGVDCRFVTGPEYGPLLAGEGLERIPRGERDGPSFAVSRWFEPLHGAMQVKHIEYALSRFDPHVIVGNMLGIGAMIASMRTGIPLVVLGGSAYIYPTARDRNSPSEPARRRTFNLESNTNILNKTLELFGMPPVPADAESSSLFGSKFLLQTCAEFYDGDRLPNGVQHVGAILWEPDAPLDDALEARLKNLRSACVYVQLARSFTYRGTWRNVVSVLGREDCEVFASAMRLDDDLGDIPRNVFIADHVPQARIMSRASYMVSTGHPTSVLGAVACGLPMLLIPNGSGTPETGELFERLGCARVCDVQRTTDSSEYFAEQLREFMATNRYREAAASVRERYAAYPAVETTAHEILSVAEAGRGNMSHAV